MTTPAESTPQPKQAPQKPAQRPLLAFAAVALGAAFAVATGLMPLSASKADSALSPAEVAARAAQFAAAGPLQLQPVPEAEADQAIADMRLPAPEAQQVVDDLRAGNLRLVYITLWDDMSEDGDVVRLSSNGLSIDVPIRHQPVRVAIPAPPQGVVNLMGVTDGGGGITVAALSGSATVLMPPLAPGQKIGIPVRPL